MSQTLNHHMNICQFGYVHGQCRCASPNKRKVNIECDRVEEHAPSDPSGSLVSMKHSSLEAIAAGLPSLTLMLSYSRREARDAAIKHLISCGDEHDFAVNGWKLMLARSGFLCLQKAELLEF